ELYTRALSGASLTREIIVVARKFTAAGLHRRLKPTMIAACVRQRKRIAAKPAGHHSSSATFLRKGPQRRSPGNIGDVRRLPQKPICQGSLPRKPAMKLTTIAVVAAFALSGALSGTSVFAQSDPGAPGTPRP